VASSRGVRTERAGGDSGCVKKAPKRSQIARVSAWFKSGLQLRGGWDRRPKGNAPRSDASALGARWLLPARSQPPNARHLRGWQSGSSRPTPQWRWGPTGFPGRQKGGDPAAAGDLRLGHRAPGRGGRRASIPLHALTTLRSALGAFCLCEFRESQQISTFYDPSVQAMKTRLGARQRRRPPTVHRGRTHAPRLQRTEASEDEASTCSELRLGCHPETPVIEPCPGVRRWQIVTWDEPRRHRASERTRFPRVGGSGQGHCRRQPRN